MICPTEKYQLMPPMSPAEFEALKADIAERGVIVPIDIDEDGDILDGHHRYRAWLALKKNEPPPTILRAGLSEAEKRVFARRNNIIRRHLSREQVRALIAEQLKDTPDWADNRIAAEIGVDGKTVGSVRDDLLATSEIPKFNRLIGADGKSRPAKRVARRGSEEKADDDDLAAVWRAITGFEPSDIAKIPAAAKSAMFDAGISVDTVAGVIFAPDPTDSLSEPQKQEWLRFRDFLIAERIMSDDEGIGHHIGWLVRHDFKTPDEWMGDAGDEYRRRWFSKKPMPRDMIEAWQNFPRRDAA